MTKTAAPMTSGSIWKQMTFFAMPIFLGNLFQQLYNTVDSLIVGNFLGSSALAAVSSSGSLIFMLIGFLSGISAGAGVIVARFFGAGDEKNLQRAVHTTVAFGLVAGVLMTGVGVALSPQILRWMDTITHTTKKGTSEFGLSNTNKLVRQYPYATGLKTGSTDEAKFCVSATAEKDGMELIAVILGGENSKQRFQDATKLLNYGFGKCQVYEDNDPPKLKPIEVQGGVKEQILCEYADTFRYLDTSGANLAGVTKKAQMKQSVKAPVKKGQKVGELVYELGEKEIGRVEILAKESCKKAEFLDYLKKVMQKIRV